VNVVVAETAEAAHARALPSLQNFSRLRTGKPLRPIDTVEAAVAAEVDGASRLVIDQMLEKWIVDAPEPAARRLNALAESFGVDEIMVSPSAGNREGEPRDRSLGRERTLELLAESLLSPLGAASLTS
jgi:alkanesulfonate monooxygenase SsuD/methylene tetrahydromethanopterin reductase-like flavin-dependent oxidoreductase (luciferase family)